MTTYPAVAATGHRPQHLPLACHAWVRAELDRVAVKLRDEQGTTVGITGMALGVDQWFARSVLAAGLDLWAYIPFPQQPDRWPAHAKDTWRKLLEQATKVHSTAQEYSVAALHQRNDEMIRDTTAIVAVYDPAKTDGGTASAVRKAVAAGRPVVRIDPITRTTRLRMPQVTLP